MHKKWVLEENISLGPERFTLIIIIFTQDMDMVSGDTPERPVIDSIIKVRWQTHVIRLWGGGEYMYLQNEKHPLYGV